MTTSSHSRNYIFFQLNEEVRRIEQRTGQKVLNFGIGSPDFPTNSQLLKQLQLLTSDPTLFDYPGYSAIPEFKAALTKWYMDRHGIDVTGLSCMVLPGAKYGITHLPLALFLKDDEVLVPDPGYPAYKDTVAFSGARVVTYDLTEKNNFKPVLEDIEQKCTKKTKFLWLNFPANPTGQMLTSDELSKLVNFAISHNLTLLYDNAYSELTFGSLSAPSIFCVPGAEKIAIEFGSFSKSYSLAGLRLGWVIGSPEVISKLQDLVSLFDSGVSLLLQKFGAFIFSNPDQLWQNDMLTHYESKRQTIAKFLKSLDLIFELPSASLYIWAKIPANYPNAELFSSELLNKKHILLTPGTAFGKNGSRFVRASIGADTSLIDRYG